MIIGVLRWGWVEVILRVSLEVILRNPLRQAPQGSISEEFFRRVTKSVTPLMAVSASIKVDFIGLLLAERLRRERGAGATARLPSAAARFG